MQIEVAKIPASGCQYVDAEDVSLLKELSGREVVSNGVIKYDLHAQFTGEDLVVSGKLSIEVIFRCSRCAEHFSRLIRDDSFAVVKQVPNRSESVDLTEDMREAILCAFPSHPVCRSDCRGLCAKCGVNLNIGKCSCSHGRDFRWDALGGIKI
jgi:uncharacterized protein